MEHNKAQANKSFPIFFIFSCLKETLYIYLTYIYQRDMSYFILYDLKCNSERK